MDDNQKAALLEKEPGAAKFVRPYIGSDEFINGMGKWILALQSAKPDELRRLPEVLRRMEIVRTKRKSSPRKQTKKIADTPTVYNVTVIPTGPFLVIPKVSSERREYIPIAYLEPPTIPSDLVFIVKDASLDLFGILVSRMHMAWVRSISGRLKSDPAIRSGSLTTRSLGQKWIRQHSQISKSSRTPFWPHVRRTRPRRLPICTTR
jgi:hypothetical protein